jgi:methylglyoxal synthase/DNA-binding transcriptional regulator LsrR (DeoR family)
MSGEAPRESLSATHTKPNLVMVASPRARSEPSSPLLRLMRDYSDIFRKYEIHTTKGTSRVICGTGMYKQYDVKAHREGKDGGIAELAAMVARGDCVAAILLLEPSDPWSDAVENRALKRVCIERHVRLITTYTAAVRWAVYEAPLSFTAPSVSSSSTSDWRPDNWKPGNENITEGGDLRPLETGERSIALISHDEKKLKMVEFVKSHLERLALHHRILTTGTTGWLLKLLYAADPQIEPFMEEIRREGKERRLSHICADLLEKKLDVVVPKFSGLVDLLSLLKNKLGISPGENFARKVMPLPSGPAGGDVLIANEVLNNQCHTIIFFHDPDTAHPHNDDIRLLEHTCQLPGVFAECVSDEQSANKWLEGLQKELNGKYNLPNPAQRLRQRWNLKEVVLVKMDDDQDSPELGETLARVAAGYLNQRLLLITQETKNTRIGIAWGWGSKHVLSELRKMSDADLLEKPELAETVVWSPLIGIITSEVIDSEAVMIAGGFCGFYGGKVEGFPCAGFARKDSVLSEDVKKLIRSLEEADIILTSASPWDEKTTLYQGTGLNRDFLPPLPTYPPRPEDAIGLISGVFLNHEGKQVVGEYSIVGLGYEGFQRAAANGAVILMCGGNERRKAVLAALRGRLVSVLITTTQTAEWILRHSEGDAASGGELRQIAHGG